MRLPKQTFIYDSGKGNAPSRHQAIFLPSFWIKNTAKLAFDVAWPQQILLEAMKLAYHKLLMMPKFNKRENLEVGIF
jgi:hypothetical protein